MAGILGSEEAVGRWLMHSTIFDEFGGAPPSCILKKEGSGR